GRCAALGMRWPGPLAPIGLATAAARVCSGLQLNPSEAQVKDFPGSGDAISGRTALAQAGISPGVMKPFVVLVEHGASREPIVARLRGTPGIAAAVAPPDWRRGSNSLVEAFPASDGAS